MLHLIILFLSLKTIFNDIHMTNNISNNSYDVIIIGGSYSGLAAALALGRALRSVLIIDFEQPCNAQTPHSHNFLTQDGKTPLEITQIAKEQVLKYNSVSFLKDLVLNAEKNESGFSVRTKNNDSFQAKKLILAAGIRDIKPDIPGFNKCWGISIIHCPYCHGYEVKNEKTGILANGDEAFHFIQLISNWTKNLTLFTNGKSTLTVEQTEALRSRNIEIAEGEIESFDHSLGNIQSIDFTDGSKKEIKALYARIPFAQNISFLYNLGCKLTEHGYIEVDQMQQTTVEGIYACGDNSNPMRVLSMAVSSGTLAGASASRSIIFEEF